MEGIKIYVCSDGKLRVRTTVCQVADSDTFERAADIIRQAKEVVA